tara:strand:- start:1125 stop:1934 length:810 start_codon:yes stop_codon:yes gene_type:complete
MSKNKKTRVRNKINQTEQSNLKRLKEIGGNIKDRIGEFTKKNAPKVKSNVKKTTKKINKSVKKNAPNLKKQGLKIGKGALKHGKNILTKGKNIVKGGATIGLRAATAKAMYESAKTGVKSWQLKGKDGKRAGLARIPGLIGKAWQNRGNLNIKKLNPASDENKRIREKKASMTKENAGKVTSQISAIKRKRDGIKLSDVRAKQEKTMRDAARKRTTQFKKDKAAKKAGKKTSYEGYNSAYDKRQAERKAAMQRKAKERNKAFKNERAKK